MERGSRNRLSIRYGTPRGIPAPAESVPQPVELDLPRDRDSLKNHWMHFAKVMQGDAEPDPDGYAGRRVIRILRAAEVSSDEGRFIKCSEVD